MAMELPASPKVYTTTYDNFKGVDFTNDSTNVWRRRSPTGVNMLPDASGRPFKRHGWEILLTQAAISAALGETECQIIKLSYFELAGKDHIVIFTDKGVLFYNGAFTAYSKVPDCYDGFDRSFFFEGGGTSAFYIYGNFRVWRYSVDENGDYVFAEVTDEATMPTVLIGASALCTGTVYRAYNLIGQYAAVEYNTDFALLNYWCSDGITLTVDESTFKTAAGSKTYFIWRRTNGSWVIDQSTGGGNLALASSGITVNGTEEDGMIIVALYLDGVMLPNNVSQTQVTDGEIKVYASTSVQYDTPLETVNMGTAPTSGKCTVCTDPIGKQSWVIFNSTDVSSWVAAWGTSGEDFIKTQFPVATITTTDYTGVNAIEVTQTADLDCEVVS